MSLKNRYENVIIRDYKSIGLSHNGLDYVLKLEKKIDKAIKLIEDIYYSKNTTDIDSVSITNNKLIQVRKILKGDVDE